MTLGVGGGVVVERWDGVSDYVGVEVSPRGVGLADKSDLPGSVPLFELALSADGGFHGVVHFVPDEVV